MYVDELHPPQNWTFKAQWMISKGVGKSFKGRLRRQLDRLDRDKRYFLKISNNPVKLLHRYETWIVKHTVKV
ncbi:hypothetical protein LIER_26669 [Lithospermum erythrorhizon]|uniref:Ribosomal protein L33 n=1 Tax=Lithospermum erythrorhizon TaxID=34254 RepID=A0AAV3R974_LITER